MNHIKNRHFLTQLKRLCSEKNTVPDIHKELCQKVIEYYSYVGDLVFDPFAGSGTLGLVAQEIDRNFILTEVDNQYFSSMKELLTSPNLFQSKSDISFLDQKFFKKRIESNL